MPNHDEAILRARCLDPTAPWPLPHQALRIALYGEYAARAFHTRMIEAFGPRAPFPAALRASSARIERLTTLCRRGGVPTPYDPYPQETRVAPAWRDNCLRACRGETTTASTYAQLLARVDSPALRDAFARLQRETLAKRLPAFENAALRAIDQERLHVAQGVAPADAYVEHGPVANILERAFSVLGQQHQAFNVVGPLLRNAGPALLAGLAAGSAGTYFVKRKTRRRS
ncbi:MAG: ferritin [Rhodocyclaceae bacterium]